MWPAITGANRTNPRPVLPTTRWSLLIDDQASGTVKTTACQIWSGMRLHTPPRCVQMMKLITLAHRTNWFHENGTAIYDETPCVPSAPYQGYQKCHVSALPEWEAAQPCNLRPMNSSFCHIPPSGSGARRRLQEPASGFPCNQQCVWDEKQGMCVDHDPVIHAGCTVCSPERPCLFDVRKDEAERDNIAAAHGALVERMSATLAELARPYVDGMMRDEDWRHLSPGGRADFECNYNATRDVWGWYAGPCCRKRVPLAP